MMETSIEQTAGIDQLMTPGGAVPDVADVA